MTSAYAPATFRTRLAGSMPATSCLLELAVVDEEPLLSMHLLASIPNGLYPEYFAAERDPVGAFLPTMAPPLRQGWVDLPEAPGFGIEVDEASVQRYRVD